MQNTLTERLITDLSIAQPSSAIAATPTQDHWLLLPYEGKQASGKMLWSPARNNPPELSIPLPKAGLCKIHIGIFASGTWPWYFNLIGVYGQRSTWVRLRLRLSDADFFDEMVPNNHPDEERLGFVTETYWKTARLDGQSLVIAPFRKEAYHDTCAFLAYIRIVPVAEPEQWPAKTKRLVQYFDSAYYGHYVAGSDDVRTTLAPFRDSDFKTILWTTCREDSCYYPTKVGNVLPAGAQTGIYPYWAGTDLHRMLDRGEDPLKSVCEIGHEYGLEVFSSYRRMTCRMPPFVYPLHPKALFVQRPDLRCADAQGKEVPHLSFTYPEVRKRMIDLLVEQATNYDIDGVHFYFSRGVPFVCFEKPFLDAFQEAYRIDPRTLSIDDPRLGTIRARFFSAMLRELRQALSVVGEKRGKPVKIAMHGQNSVRNCLHYGIDIAGIAKEGLLDIFLPDAGHFLPPELGRKDITADAVTEFLAAARGTNLKIIPTLLASTEKSAADLCNLAVDFYRAGVEGLQPGHGVPYNAVWQIQRRMGHIEELSTLDARRAEWERIVRFNTMAGLPFDGVTGVTTCG